MQGTDGFTRIELTVMTNIQTFCALIAALVFALVLSTAAGTPAARARAPRVLSAGQLPNDRRLGPLQHAFHFQELVFVGSADAIFQPMMDLGSRKLPLAADPSTIRLPYPG